MFQKEGIPLITIKIQPQQEEVHQTLLLEEVLQSITIQILIIEIIILPKEIQILVQIPIQAQEDHRLQAEAVVQQTIPQLEVQLLDVEEVIKKVSFKIKLN